MPCQNDCPRSARQSLDKPCEFVGNGSGKTTFGRERTCRTLRGSRLDSSGDAVARDLTLSALSWSFYPFGSFAFFLKLLFECEWHVCDLHLSAKIYCACHGTLECSARHAIEELLAVKRAAVIDRCGTGSGGAPRSIRRGIVRLTDGSWPRGACAWMCGDGATLWSNRRCSWSQLSCQLT